MPTSETMSFLAVLANVDESIRRVAFPGLRVTSWPWRKLATLLSIMSELPEHVFQVLFEQDWNCILPSGRVLTLQGRIHVPDTTARSTEDERRFAFRAEVSPHNRVNEQIALMRLFCEGAIEVVTSYVYYLEDGVPTPTYSVRHEQEVEDNIFALSAAEASLLDTFITSHELPSKPAYVKLAYENFAQSYDVRDPKLKFLLLMIAAEVLFNDAAQELRYRVSRGVATLLARNAAEGQHIFIRMKKLYDKRSLLVHTGTSDAATMDDVLELRHFVRRSIVVLANRSVSKDELSLMLTSTGFGNCPYAT